MSDILQQGVLQVHVLKERMHISKSARRTVAFAHRLLQASQVHLPVLRERQLPVAHAPLP